MSSVGWVRRGAGTHHVLAFAGGFRRSRNPSYGGIQEIGAVHSGCIAAVWGKIPLWGLQMVGDAFITLVIVLMYGWLVFKIAAILATRVKRFSLRDLLVLLTVAALCMFFITRFGPISSIVLGVVTLAAVFFGTFKIIIP
jgi:hypothetical protein